MLKPSLKTIQEHIELLKDIKWLKENISKLSYPKELNIDDFYKFEAWIIKELIELIKKEETNY